MLLKLTNLNNMKNKIKYLLIPFVLLASLYVGCQKDDYDLGDLTAPSNLVIETQIQGQDASNPNGDGSGNVSITVSANDAMTYKIGYRNVTNLSDDALEMTTIASGTTTRKFTDQGVQTYRITVIAYGKGGTSSVLTKEVTVLSLFDPGEQVITSLTNNSSKTWVVNKDIPGHFGVGPWDQGSYGPDWWSAAINEKVACCNCFYTARFTFNKVGNAFSIDVATPDGAFTKTGDLASIPGIPASGDEGCYSYAGGSSSFAFVPSSVSPSNDTVQTTGAAILLGGSGTFIGYGALKKEFEILEITDNSMYLRVQGTEPGNAWYLRLVPVQ